MDDNDYCVYIHRLKSDGRVYIGQTCNIASRWSSNGSRYEQCRHFWNAICKYGWSAFEHIILLDGLSKDEADVYEDILITQYKSTDKKHGFNLRGGGSRGKQSPETIEKMRAANIGKKMPEEMRKKMSTSRMGTILSEQHKANISKGHKNSETARAHLKEMTENCKKRVLCIETGETFESVNDAAKSVGVSKTCISECIHGKQKTSGGYHWTMCEEGGKKSA